MTATGLDGRCVWCRYLVEFFGHDAKCCVPKGLGHLLVPAKPSKQVLRTSPAGPTSRELFAAAQRSGTTIGHEWGRQRAP